MKYMFNGDLVQGGPVEIVEEMKSQTYDHDRFKSLDEYMEWFTGSIWRFYGKGVTIHGESLEDRCSSLITRLLAIDLLIPIDD